MLDVETVDLLLITYIQLLHSMNENKIPTNFSPFQEMVKSLHLKEVDIGLLRTVSFKIKVEDETRGIIRSNLRTQIKEIQDNLSKACIDIASHAKKDVLLIIDDLDKLETDFAERIFIKDSYLLTLPMAKIVYTFPLDTYYRESFNTVNEKYEDLLIPIVDLQDKTGAPRAEAFDQLRRVVHKRIDPQYIAGDALKYIIDNSGGLLRDVVKYMQDCCKLAIRKKVDQIDMAIAQRVINKYIADYYRVFDSEKYGQAVEVLMTSGKKTDIRKTKLVDLLRYLFIMEYRSPDQEFVWYDLHPCFRKALERNQ